MAIYKQPPINLAKQYGGLASCYKGLGKLTRNKLIWEFKLQPTPISREYSLVLEYSIHRSPKIFVVAPNLKELAGGKTIPHMYDQNKGKLCLYLPRSGEWSNRLYLRDTIIPWSSVWLYFFEEWLLTKEWKGGGAHPVITEKSSETYSQKLPKRFK